MKKFNWPLNVSNFTVLDRLKIASFFLNPKRRWTQGNQVSLFEKEMANTVGAKWAVFVSSGSTANTLLAMRESDRREKGRNVVVLPATTWTTSCAPWIREGFDPYFIDVGVDDLSIDLKKLEAYLRKNSEKVACVFITTLLGNGLDFEKLQGIVDRYNVKLMFDNCESNFLTENYFNTYNSTTSTYFGHMLNSVEGGFVFTNNEEDYEYFLMARNHGLVRSLWWGTGISKYQNENVDPRFDFALLGSNFRNSDINAYIGRLDLKRYDEYYEKRIALSFEFYKCLGSISFHKYFRRDPLFCFPIIPREPWEEGRKEQILNRLAGEGIETRPIISGNLLKQTAYKKYKGRRSFPVADYIHENGFYIGLHTKLKWSQLKEAAKLIKR